jgi:hypothetical protein
MGDNTKRILRLHTDLNRVMTDERFDDGRQRGHELRSFIVAYYWARFEGGDKDAAWIRTKTLAGFTAHRFGAQHTSYRLREAYRSDAPRFEPANFRHAQPTCPAPMLRGPRVGEPCGKAGTYSFRVTDPATGEWELRGWCSRHRAEAERARRYEQTVKKPEPLPNTGGLLPCYIPASNWPDIYTAASPGWKPPSIGLCADNWPVMARVVAHERPKFEALDGGGDSSDADDATLPALRLVST